MFFVCVLGLKEECILCFIIISFRGLEQGEVPDISGTIAKLIGQILREEDVSRPSSVLSTATGKKTPADDRYGHFTHVRSFDMLTKRKSKYLSFLPFSSVLLASDNLIVLISSEIVYVGCL